MVRRKRYDYECTWDGEEAMKKHFKYAVVLEGDLDINNVMFLKNKSDVIRYLDEQREMSDIQVLLRVEYLKGVIYGGDENGLVF